MIKEAIEVYFKKLDSLWIEKRKLHPLIPYTEKMPKFMYIGEVNNSNYIQWKISKNENTINFNNISSCIGIELHNDLKEYFSSYYFLKMVGIFNNVKLIFTPITPLVDILIFLRERINIAAVQGRDINKIEIGFAEIDGQDSFLLLFNNLTGCMEVMDSDSLESFVIANSLYDLIINMSPRC